MKILVVGSGGREHAIIKSLKNNSNIKKIYAAPGNGGISHDAECVPIKAVDINSMTIFAKENAIDYVIVAPDDPLALGMVDALEEKEIRCFGPNKAAARIESSKIFAKDLMQKYNIPTASYKTFYAADEASEYIKSDNVEFPIVIKADGLALGKGVVIANNRVEAHQTIMDFMLDKKFGDSGKSIVIEEFLTGPEVSVLAFTDGKTVKPMISSMDHKRIFDGNTGLNTGGMGAIAPNPHYTADIAAFCEKTIFLPTIAAMQKEGCPFKGCLYFGLMLTPQGPKVIEYNCRFGDPETQVVLSLLETDLLEIMQAVTDEKLDSIDISWKNDNAACVIIASGGYPLNYDTNLEITGLNKDGGISGCIVYHSGTSYKDGAFYTAGGRVLGVTGIASTLKNALENAYNGVKNINFDKKHCRTDIGSY
ncbi:MAG: phosphoribosylamine--glycine ligase [Treponema sp.]|jgi:phosphoribosylamine--glycine ligase|nr:phosphoribosylamine--glycine ligase [Treponema sp.]